MKTLFWGLFLILSFLVTLPASWWLFSKVDFGYGFLYEPIGISQHIADYAPKNNQGKLGFESTSKAERVALFHGIAEAIQQQGKGLVQLDYRNLQGQQIGLLTVAEIIHLRDVANLIDKLKPLAALLIAIWLAIIAVLKIKRIKLPTTRRLLLNSLVIGMLMGVAFGLLGPETVFNQLHIWVFPALHQWFFYYEESLMSTMMKAPDLFAYIAGIWALLSIVLSALVVKLLRVFL